MTQPEPAQSAPGGAGFKLPKRALGFLLALLLLGWMSHVLWARREQLRGLVQLEPVHVAVMVGATLGRMLLDGVIQSSLLRTLGVRVPLGELILLRNASIMLNYLPAKAGTLLRATYLQRLHGLEFSRFAILFAFLFFLNTLAAGALGLVGCVSAYGLQPQGAGALLMVCFLVGLAGSCVALFMPLPTPAGEGKLAGLLRRLVEGRALVSSQRRLALTCAACTALGLALSGVWYGAVLASLQQRPSWGGILAVSCVGAVVQLVALTPGSLGIKEGALSAATLALGVPLEAALLAALLSRAAGMVVVFALGGPSTLLLWRRHRVLREALGSGPPPPSPDPQGASA